MLTPVVSLATETSVWYRAVTLSERLAGPAVAAASLPPEPIEHLDADVVRRLEYRVASWKSQKPFDRGEHFQHRLSLDNLTEEELRRLIREPLADIRARFSTTPDWVATIEAALSSTPTFEFHDFLSNRLKRDPLIGFLDAAAPFITLGLRRLEARAEKLARCATVCPFEPFIVPALLFPNLAQALLRIVARTMVLELNAARVEERLSGSTAEERFSSFIAQLHDAVCLRAILEEYPVLARLVAEQTDRWVTVSLELLERLTEDFGALEKAFTGGEPLGSLVGVTQDLADPHDGGRSVAVVRFSSGARVVYKPSSLAVDAHFQGVVRWLTDEGFAPGFRPSTVLDRGRYGWVEFAPAAECQTSDEVTRFYERIGGYLALLLVMNARDFHAGNVIASGEHPVLIDLEALFHPHRSLPPDPHAASADEIARRSIRNSVLRIGLLPERLWGNAEHDGVDISGLGAPKGQLTPYLVAAWDESGTDSMRVVRKRGTIKADDNRPTFRGEPVDVIEHRDAILRGFRSAYSILGARRRVLLAPGGPFDGFAQDPVSVFLRSSRTYRRLLRESYHPDVLRDAIDRDRLFDLLWAAVPGDPDMVGVIRSERDDLWNGDVPRFTARPASRDLWLSDQNVIAEFFPEPGFSSVQRILDQMGEAACERQAWYIEASLASLPGVQLRRLSHRIVPSESPLRSDRLVAAAVAVGNRLEELAIRGANDVSWIGLELERRRVWSIARAGLDLDSGIPGIALFLAYLGAVTGSEAATALAHAAQRTMSALLAERSASRLAVGGFDGLGGVIYVLSHLATLWGRSDLLAAADELVLRLPKLVDKNESNVYGGAAGCILALRSFQKCRPSDHTMAVAIQWGDHLLRSAQQPAVGVTRPPVVDTDTSRGSALSFRDSGIAYALLELCAWTGIERFHAGALRSLDCQRNPWSTHLDVDEGIDLYRLCCAPARIGDPAARADMAAVARVIRDRGFGWNHSLGHGDLGSLEFLTRAANLLEDEALSREADRMAVGILDDIEQRGWRCGAPLGLETPGLLAGLAGIGYGLLRTARPDVVPSVLALEPPISLRGAHDD
jgi:class II lanthipeptide synthase